MVQCSAVQVRTSLASKYQQHLCQRQTRPGSCATSAAPGVSQHPPIGRRAPSCLAASTEACTCTRTVSTKTHAYRLPLHFVSSRGTRLYLYAERHLSVRCPPLSGPLTMVDDQLQSSLLGCCRDPPSSSARPASTPGSHYLSCSFSRIIVYFVCWRYQ